MELLVTLLLSYLILCHSVKLVQDNYHGDPTQTVTVELGIHDLLEVWPKQAGSRYLPSLSKDAIVEGIDKLSRQFNLHIKTSVESNRKLVAKLKSLHGKLKPVQKGGTALSRLINRFKSQNFKWKIKFEEVKRDSILKDFNILSNENSRLKKNKKVLEKRLSSAIKMTNKISKQKAKLFSKIGGQKKRKRHARKSWDDLTSKRKSQLISDCQINLDFLGLYGLTATEVQTIDSKGEMRTVKLMNQNERNFFQVSGKRVETVCDDDMDKLNMTLFAKDQYSITDVSYKYLSRLFDEMPRFYSVQKRIETINKKWKIKSKDNVVYYSVKDTLEERLQNLSHDHLADNTINVKISGDGTLIGKRLNLCVVSIVVLNEEENAKNARGNHIVCLIKGGENYNLLKYGLKETIDEIKDLNSIKYNGSQITIKWFLGGDYKFLLCVSGLDSANSTHPCLWCITDKNSKHILSKKWSMTKKGARTQALLKKWYPKHQYNTSRPSLFPFIPIENTIVDPLHLFLRVTDRLLMLLVNECRRQDGLSQKTKKIIKDKNIHMTKLETILSDNNIYFSWKTDEMGNLQYPELRGPEKILLYEFLDITTLIPGYKNANKFQEVWQTFFELVTMLKSSTVDVKMFNLKAQQWLKKCLNVFQTRDITPYMHILCFHVGEMLHLHGNIAQFTQQGLERINDLLSTMYFKSTNQSRKTALKQLLLKHKRLQYYIDHKYPQPPRPYTCTACGETGHSVKSCRPVV